MTDKRYPNCERLSEMSGAVENAQLFVEWLNGQGYCIAKREVVGQLWEYSQQMVNLLGGTADCSSPYPNNTTNNLILHWVGVDPHVLNKERDAVLNDFVNGGN